MRTAPPDALSMRSRHGRDTAGSPGNPRRVCNSPFSHCVGQGCTWGEGERQSMKSWQPRVFPGNLRCLSHAWTSLREHQEVLSASAPFCGREALIAMTSSCPPSTAATQNSQFSNMTLGGGDGAAPGCAPPRKASGSGLHAWMGAAAAVTDPTPQRHKWMTCATQVVFSYQIYGFNLLILLKPTLTVLHSTSSSSSSRVKMRMAWSWRAAVAMVAVQMLSVAAHAHANDSEQDYQKGVRGSVSVDIQSPQDFSIVDKSVEIKFTVLGADKIQDTLIAAILLNNQEAVPPANVTLNGALTTQNHTVEIMDMAQNSWDLSIVIVDTECRYMGVSAIASFGVVREEDKEEEDGGKGDTRRGAASSRESVQKSIERKKFVHEQTWQHSQDLQALMRSDVGEGRECGPCGGVVGYDDALARGISEVLMFEGREQEAKMCLGKSGDSEEATKTVESRLGVLFELHDKLYSKMREASPNDSAMGMEGNSGALRWQTRLYHLLASTPHIKTVCETGFGAGHSSISWMLANSQIQVHAFDLGELRGVSVGEQFVESVFSQRLKLIRGDSSWTVPEYLDQHPDLRCDIVHIDGGHHDLTPWNDIIALARASHEGTILLIDDTPSLVDVARAVRMAQSHGLLREIACPNVVDFDNNTKARHLRGFCLAQYTQEGLAAVQQLEVVS